MGQKTINLSSYFIKKNSSDSTDLSSGGTDGTTSNGARNGLMTGADKYKLDNISDNANNYVHPTFTSHVLGDYNIAVDANGHITNVSSKVGDFTELQTLIDNASAGDTITLEKDYKNTGNLNTTFNINKEIHIDGNGHLIDYNNTRYCFSLKVQNSTIENCIIEGGATDNNAAFWLDADNCSFINVIFRNTNGLQSELIFGQQRNNIIIKNCYFYNINDDGNNDLIFLQGGSNCYIEDCIFLNNNVEGIIYMTGSNSIVKSCTFLNNATYLGAVYANNNTIINCIFENNTKIRSNNYTGGAITGSSSSKIINNKFLTNTDTIYPSTIVQKEYLTDTTDQVSSGSTVPVTSGAVYSAINSLNTQLNEAISTSFKVEVLSSVDVLDILHMYGTEDGTSFKSYIEDQTNIQLSYDSSTIYLVYNSHEQGSSSYNEYIYVESDGNYELIGTTDIDLSNYVQKSSTTGLLKNDGTVMTSGTGANNFAAGNHTHSQYLTSHQDISGKLNKSELLNELNTIVEDLIDEGDS